MTSRRNFIKGASLLALGNILPFKSVFAAATNHRRRDLRRRARRLRLQPGAGAGRRRHQEDART